MNAPVQRWTLLFLAAVFGACVSASAESEADSHASQHGARVGSPRFVAGALHLPKEPGMREVYGMNVGWRFFKRTEAPEGVYAPGFVKTQVANGTREQRAVQVGAVLKDEAGKEIARASDLLELPAGQRGEVVLRLNLRGIRAWSPDEPNLYRLDVRVAENADGKTAVLDERALMVGLRTIRLDDQGLTLNGTLYSEKLIGGNRHQDFATLGNAVPNNLQEQDAVKLRRAGMRVIRSAHYREEPEKTRAELNRLRNEQVGQPTDSFRITNSLQQQLS